MVKTTVILNDMNKMKRFIDKVFRFESNIDAVKERYVVNAKSVMGLFSLDLSEPIELRLYSASEDEMVKFINDMKEFQYKWLL